MGSKVIFISLEDSSAAAAFGMQLEAEFNSIQRVALSAVENPPVLRLALQLRMEIPIDETEAWVGLPVFAQFPCDYADVTLSIRQAESSTKLAAAIR